MIDRLHTITVGDVLRDHRRSRGDLLAIVDGPVRLTYRELDERVNRLAAALRRVGAGEGERLLWLGRNSFRVLELLLAAAKVGAMAVPADGRRGPDELAFAIDDLRPAVVVWQKRGDGDSALAARERSPRSAHWLVDGTDGPESYEAFLRAGDAVDQEHPVDPRSPVLGFYSATFEGRPDCALLDHVAVLFESLAIARVAALSDETVLLNSGPLFHAAPLAATCATYQFGGTNVFLAEPDPEEICRLVEAERCTTAFLAAPTLARIREANHDGRWDLTSLWGPDDPADLALWTPGAHPSTLGSGSDGTSDIGGLTTSYAHGTHPAHERPMPVVLVRVLGEDGAELPAGEVGEIAVRGPTVVVGYHDRNDLNEERFRGGWHHTGDLGRREADGSITLLGPEDADDHAGRPPARGGYREE